MVAGITRIAKVADEAAAAAKKAAELAKRRSKAAKKGAKTKAANRKAAEKAKARRSRGGKKAKKTKDKNIRAAEKAAAAEEKAKKAARQKEHTGKKPAQEGLPDEYHERGGRADAKHVVKTPEGAQEESFKAGQLAPGEKVTVGKESGAIPNYAKDMMDNLSAKRKTALTKYFKNGESFKGMAAQQKRDAQYALRYVRKEADSPSYSARAASAEGRKKAAAAKRTDSYDKLLQTGEIQEGFEPTTKQIQQAINNMKARGKTSRVRQLEARLESRDPAVRGLRGRDGGPFPGAGRPAGHPSDKVTEADKVRKRGATPYQPREVKGEDDLVKLLRRTERAGFKRGGLTKAGHKDYRTGGLFY